MRFIYEREKFFDLYMPRGRSLYMCIPIYVRY